MIRTLASSLALAVVMAGAAFAEVHEIKMLNKGEDGERMVFEPAAITIAPGDTLKFLAVDKSHNAESIPEMMPEGAETFRGKTNEEIEVTFDVEGVYGIKCKPHFAMGMVLTVAVGEVEVPEGFLEAAKLPKKAKERFEAQVEAVSAGES